MDVKSQIKNNKSIYYKLNKKILILIESINPDDSSGVKGRLALINNLMKIGHHIKVIHLDESYTNDESFETKVVRRFPTSTYFWLSKLNTFAKKFGIKLNKWVEPQFGFSFSHYEDVARFKEALTRENTEHYDIVFTLSKAASFRPHKAVLESQKWHNKWYAYIHDPYPFHCYPRPYDWIAPGDRQKMRFMQNVFDRAVHIVFPSHLLSEWMYSYYPADKQKNKIIPHQIDNQLLPSSESLPKDFDISKINILHAGSLLQHRNPIALLRAFTNCLKEQNIPQNIVLWFVGGGLSHFKNEFDIVNKDYSENVKTLNRIEFKVAYTMQSFADINIILESKSYISPFLPGKLPHLIKANRPIIHIGPKLSETYRLMNKELNFINTKSDNLNGLKDSIIVSVNNLEDIDFSQKLFSLEIRHYFSESFLIKKIS